MEGTAAALFAQNRDDEYMMALSTVERQGVDWAELLGGDGSGQLDVMARSLKNTDMQFI